VDEAKTEQKVERTFLFCFVVHLMTPSLLQAVQRGENFKDLEGNCSGQIVVTSQFLPGGIEENHEKL
jgi:hypothetical protein